MYGYEILFVIGPLSNSWRITDPVLLMGLRKVFQVALW